MIRSIFDPKVDAAFQSAKAAAAQGNQTRAVSGTALKAPYPFASPSDWRSCPIYFLLTDRFKNGVPGAKPVSGRWDAKFGNFQGGTFKGIQQQLGYLADLGMKAIWMTPVVKNSAPNWAFLYPGYNAQNFLEVDSRFGTAQDLQDLVTEAHARGLFVILDIVLNHTGRVFDYAFPNQVTDSFTSVEIMNGPLGSEPHIQWQSGLGFPRPDWQDTFPAGQALSDDDAVYPDELRNFLFFRRRGNKISDAAPKGGFARGDFGTMRQMVQEYDASSQPALRQMLGPRPVLSILVRCYEYLIAQFDFDGFRIDTVKYVDPDMVQTFGNAMREYANSIGKTNFFTYGEVFDNEQTIDNFVGRQGTASEGFGIDAALDFPLFFVLPGIAKCQNPVEGLRTLYDNRKQTQSKLISSHGEAGKFFVSFLENHDQEQRFNHPQTPQAQIELGLALLFCLQGIPCVYYGMEQGLDGTKDNNGNPNVGPQQGLECVREALWGKPGAFNPAHPLFQEIRILAALRGARPPQSLGLPAAPIPRPCLSYGRQYFREVSQNGTDFGHSVGVGGIVAFSRILADQEVVIIANTSTTQPFAGFVVVDPDLHRQPVPYRVIYSNMKTTGSGAPVIMPINFWADGHLAATVEMGRLFVKLAPMEVQILAQ